MVLRGSAGANAVGPTNLASDCSVTCATATNCVTWSTGIARFNAYAIGTVPTRISMIKPMPFWPSLEPCANDTPVQVSTSNPRIHHGGGFPAFGRFVQFLVFHQCAQRQQQQRGDR